MLFYDKLSKILRYLTSWLVQKPSFPFETKQSTNKFKSIPCIASENTNCMYNFIVRNVSEQIWLIILYYLCSTNHRCILKYNSSLSCMLSLPFFCHNCNMIFSNLFRPSQKWKFCHNALLFCSIQTCFSFFLGTQMEVLCCYFPICEWEMGLLSSKKLLYKYKYHKNRV